jgi:hypothetical protein
MKEQKGNIGFVHAKCAKERYEKFQKENPVIELKKGNCVKLGFPTGIEDDKEWMWLEVCTVDNESRTAVGQLISPSVMTDYRLYQLFDFDYNEIMDIAEKIED